jgi:hypothetical protein
MFSFQSYTIAIMIGRNSVNRDRCMTFDILTSDFIMIRARPVVLRNHHYDIMIVRVQL